MRGIGGSFSSAIEREAPCLVRHDALMVDACEIRPKLLAPLLQVRAHEVHHQAFADVARAFEPVAFEGIVAAQNLEISVPRDVFDSIVRRRQMSRRPELVAEDVAQDGCHEFIRAGDAAIRFRYQVKASKCGIAPSPQMLCGGRFSGTRPSTTAL